MDISHVSFCVSLKSDGFRFLDKYSRLSSKDLIKSICIKQPKVIEIKHLPVVGITSNLAAWFVLSKFFYKKDEYYMCLGNVKWPEQIKVVYQ